MSAQPRAESTSRGAAKRTAKAAPPGVIALDYSLAVLPSAQHRAGLAGLVLMVRWLDRQPGPKVGTCAFTRIDDLGATLSLDLDGLQRLFDEVYAADKEL